MTAAGQPLPVVAVSSHGQLGGSELYLLRLLQALGNRVVAHVVVLQEGPLVALVREAGFATTVVPAGRRAGLIPAALRLRRVVAAQRPALVHANGVKAAAVASLALAGRREPMLWVKHDHSWDGAPARFLARRAARVVAVSESALSAVRGVSDGTVVRTGVSVEPVDRASAATTLREAIGAAPSDPVLVVVGRLDPAKGFDVAVDVLARLRHTHPRAHLAVVGGADASHPGVGDALVRRAEAAGIRAWVHLLGHRDDAAVLVGGADVVLVVSRAVDRRGTGREGFGLVAAEALLLGTPVAGFDDGATPEVVGSAGLLVRPGDTEALVARVRSVLDDADVRARLAAAASERALLFDVTRWADEVAAIYAELAARNGAR
jgi:glycosyltransferase involved in cell wall biosynthesis